MTDYGYFATTTAVSPAPVRDTGWKLGLTLAVAVFAPPAAAVAAFLAVVEWSGCFIGCSSTPDHMTGGLLGALAATLVLAGPALAACLLRSVKWAAVAVAIPFAEAGLLALQYS